MLEALQLQAVPTGASAAETAARHTRLLQAAQQFEAVMLGELMKPLASSAAFGTENDAGGSNALQSYGVESMAGALAHSGALGFAERIVSAVEGVAGRRAELSHSEDRNGTVHLDFSGKGTQVPAGSVDSAREE